MKAEILRVVSQSSVLGRQYKLPEYPEFLLFSAVGAILSLTGWKASPKAKAEKCLLQSEFAAWLALNYSILFEFCVPSETLPLHYHATENGIFRTYVRPLPSVAIGPTKNESRAFWNTTVCVLYRRQSFSSSRNRETAWEWYTFALLLIQTGLHPLEIQITISWPTVFAACLCLPSIAVDASDFHEEDCIRAPTVEKFFFFCLFTHSRLKPSPASPKCVCVVRENKTDFGLSASQTHASASRGGFGAKQHQKGIMFCILFGLKPALAQYGCKCECLLM